MKKIKITSKTTGKEYEIRILGNNNAIHHEDLMNIVKEEGITFSMSHWAPYSYPACEKIAFLGGKQATGFGSCTPGCTSGLAASDPVKAARCDAMDNAVIELMDFDWNNVQPVNNTDVVNDTDTATTAVIEDTTNATASEEEPDVAHSISNVTAAAVVENTAPDTATPSVATSETDEIAKTVLAFGRYKNSGKTVAELFAAGGEETDWYNYICDTKKDNGEYKYTGKYPDMMRKYRAVQG